MKRLTQNPIYLLGISVLLITLALFFRMQRPDEDEVSQAETPEVTSPAPVAPRPVPVPSGKYIAERRLLLPSPEQPHYKELEQQLYTITKKNGFRPQEFPYSQGTLRITPAQNGQPEKRRAVWRDVSGYCTLTAELSPSFQVVSSDIRCKN